MTEETRVEGEITFAEDAPALRGKTVHVRVRDVGRVDSPSRVVAEQALTELDLSEEGQSRIPFSLAVPALDPDGSYSVHVHVDMDGDGEISRGDFITMESYPVLTRGFPNRIRVRVRRVS